MSKRKKSDVIEVTVTTSRSMTFDLSIPYWDQLVKVAEAILERRDDGIPDNAEVTFQGDAICVDWDDA